MNKPDKQRKIKQLQDLEKINQIEKVDAELITYFKTIYAGTKKNISSKLGHCFL
jgi:hypothetical protein